MCYLPKTLNQETDDIMKRTAIVRTAIVAMAALALSACGINSVPTKEEAAKAQWGNVETALQRRSDVIPNLVSVVQAAAISEQNILQGVIDARARATSINITTDDLSNPEEFQRFNESVMSHSVQQLGHVAVQLIIELKTWEKNTLIFNVFLLLFW